MPDGSGSQLIAGGRGQPPIRVDAEQVAIGLAWFSIGMGLAKLFAPHRLTRAVGLRYAEPFMGVAGVRGVATGAGILLSRDKSPWLRARVAFDAMDMAFLTYSLRGRRPATALLGLVAAAGVAALDHSVAQDMAEREGRSAAAAGPRAGGRGWRLGNLELARSITVGKPAAELLQLWQAPATLPKVMGPLATVEQLGEGRARWTLLGRLGRNLSWTTRITAADLATGLQWEAEPGMAAVVRQGEVTFRPAPANRGTEVTLRVQFSPPGGAAGRSAAALLGDIAPGAMLDTALHYFKALAETGEVPTTAGQPAARRDPR